jgi:predicted PurR-regulated permease PerM
MVVQPASRLSLRVWLGLLALGLTLWLIIKYNSLIAEIIWLLLGSLILSLAVRPIADWLGHRRVPRGIAALVAYLFIAGVIVLLVTTLSPIIVMEAKRLQTGGISLPQAVLTQLVRIPLIGPLLPSTSVLVQDIVQRLGTLAQAGLMALSRVSDLLVDILITLVTAYFLVAERDLLARSIGRWMPVGHRERVEATLELIEHRLTRWLWAQTALAAFFAVTFGLSLLALGVPFALTIGLLGGVLEVVPFLGGLVAVLLGSLSALTVSPILALWVVVIYIVIAQVEDRVLRPVFYGRIVGLHPVIVLLALFVGVRTGGIIGLIFAIPLAVIATTLGEEARLHLVNRTGQPLDGKG